MWATLTSPRSLLGLHAVMALIEILFHRTSLGLREHIHIFESLFLVAVIALDNLGD